MRNPRFVWIAVTLLVAAAPAFAQRGPGRPPGRGPGNPNNNDDAEQKIEKWVAKIGEPAPEIEASSFANIEGKVALRDYRGRIVVLYFFRTDRSEAVETIATVNSLYAALDRAAVVVIGLTPQKKDDAEGTIKGKEVKFVVGYEAKFDETYQVTSFPEIYLIDPQGTLVNRFHPADDLEAKVRRQIELTPPEGADPKALQNRVQKARDALTAKEVGRAYTLAKELDKLLDKGSTLAEGVKKLLSDIEEEAKKSLEEAREAIKAEDFEKACRILAMLSVRFAGQDIAGQADTEIGRLMGDRENKTRMRKAQDNARGEVLLEQAADMAALKRYPEALHLYQQVSEDYPDTDAAKTADAEAEKIRSDPAAREVITRLRADAEADRWLDIADRFAKVEMYEQAREYYEQIIKTHPDSRAAAPAKQKLAALPEKAPEDPNEPTPEPAADDSTAGKDDKP